MSLSWGQSDAADDDATDPPPVTTQNCGLGDTQTGPNGNITVPGVTSGHATFHFFDKIGNQTCNMTIGAGLNGVQPWIVTVQLLMRNTLHLLAVIELCWAAALWAFEQEHLNGLAAEMIKKMMFISFFYMLLQYAQEWIPAIVNSFSAIGTDVTGIGPSTDDIIATGLAEINFMFNNAPKLGWGNVAEWAMLLLIAVGVIASAVILAAQFFMAQLESYIMLVVGAVFLGLGGSTWTKKYTDHLFDYALSVGVRLLTIILVCELTKAFVEQAITPEWQFSIQCMTKLGAITLMQLMMALKAPEMATALMGGGTGMSAGSAGGALGSVMSVASKGLSLATGAAGLANSAMKGAASLAKGGGGGKGSSASVPGLGKGGGAGGAAGHGGAGGAAGKAGAAAGAALKGAATAATGGGGGGAGHGGAMGGGGAGKGGTGGATGGGGVGKGGTGGAMGGGGVGKGGTGGAAGAGGAGPGGAGKGGGGQSNSGSRAGGSGARAEGSGGVSHSASQSNTGGGGSGSGGGGGDSSSGTGDAAGEAADDATADE